MTDATPAYLDPSLGATPPRPRGCGAGDYPQQVNAAGLALWTIGVSTRAIRQPFGDTVGAPLHEEYDTCPYALLAVNCLGDPEHPDDRSVVQISQDNPPQAGRVFTCWFWFDWLRNTAAASASFNRSLATKTANASLGNQARAGVTRPCLGVSSLAANSGKYPTSLANITIAAPGSATIASLDCPLVAEDGSAAAPQPLRVPCWVGRWGFRGAVGQVLTGGTSTQNLGFFLKVRPLTVGFTEDAANRRIALGSGTAEYGCEAFGACVYTMVLVDSPATYSDMDTTQPAPYPCRAYGPGCWKSREQTAYIQVYLTPLGDAWQAVVSISQVLMTRTAGSGRYILYSNFSAGYYTEKGSVQVTRPAEDVSVTTIACGASTTVTKTLFTGEATLTLQIVVSATGVVTTCEARITRNVSVTNLGPGWHDWFGKM